MTFLRINLTARAVLLLIAIVLIPLGLACKFYTGFGAQIVTNKLCGSFYVLFGCLILRVLYSRVSLLNTIVIVTLLTILIEFSQIASWSLLQFLRRSFIGRSIVGDSFNWLDFPFYFLGSVAAYFLIRKVEIHAP